jgi:peroxiredoxin Q/BCP
VRDEIEQFRELHVTPVGINPAGVESHRKYAAKMKFPFILISDADRSIARAYGALRLGGLSVQRSVVGIDEDGIVRYAVRGAPPASEILGALRA